MAFGLWYPLISVESWNTTKALVENLTVIVWTTEHWSHFLTSIITCTKYKHSTVFYSFQIWLDLSLIYNNKQHFYWFYTTTCTFFFGLKLLDFSLPLLLYSLNGFSFLLSLLLLPNHSLYSPCLLHEFWR